MHRPPNKRPKPRDYLLTLSQQLAKMMHEQEITTQDIEKALEIIKLSRC